MSEPINSPEQQEATPAAGGEHTFTQAEVDAIVSREKAKAAAKALKESSNEDYKAQYEAVKKELEDMKVAQLHQQKEAVYRDLLEKANIHEKRIATVMKASTAEIDALELDENGKAVGADKLVETIKTEWADFVIVTRGANVPHPPMNTGGGVDKIADAFKPKI